MNNKKYIEKMANICGYDNKIFCIMGDCTDHKLCRKCDVMKMVNPDEYNFYQNLNIKSQDKQTL